MILANYAQQNRNAVREWGSAFSNPLGQFKPTLFHAWATPDTALTSLQRSAFNNGYNTSYAWWPAMKSGGIASTLNIRGTGTLSVSALAVKLAEADLTGSGELAALGSLIVQAVAAISGSGTISSASLQAFLAAVASIGGSGTISSADLEGLGALLAAISGSGTAAGSTISAIGELDADITVTGTGLSTANVGQAVWSALAASNNEPDTMGEKLNDAGSAGNPWNTVIEGTYTAEEMLRLIAAALLGKATATGTTYTVRDLQDTLDRIVADVDSSGNRTEVDLDPT